MDASEQDDAAQQEGDQPARKKGFLLIGLVVLLLVVAGGGGLVAAFAQLRIHRRCFHRCAGGAHRAADCRGSERNARAA